MTLPADRGHLATEHRNPSSADLDTLGVGDCVRLLADDHRAVGRAVEAAAAEITTFVEGLVPRMRAGGRLVYVGAGTSGRLGVLDASECPPTFCSDPDQVVGIIAGGDAALRRSSERREDDPDGARAALAPLALGPPDTVLGIAAGGTTPYVLGSLRIAAEAGAATALLTCADPDPPPAACGQLIVLRTGPEVLAGSTRLKAGSATKLALNIITTTAFVQLGKVFSNLMVDLRASNDKLTDRAVRILRETAGPLTRAEAAACLDAAGGRLKTAIVMRRLGLPRDEAERRLAGHDGRLRAALGAEAGLQDPGPVSIP
ncbi:MAG: N-acetylmuramic acid 6-phosphate etherase [Planctomycetota bacterium]|jgi:N-acetylmuramic acid 6-phosphate etherase